MRLKLGAWREAALESKLVTGERESTKNGLVIYTIGHSIHSMETFIFLLNANWIEVLVDVRLGPYSRKMSHFNKDNLEREIKRSGLKYVFLGKEPGGRPKGREFYDKEG